MPRPEKPTTVGFFYDAEECLPRHPRDGGGMGSSLSPDSIRQFFEKDLWTLEPESYAGIRGRAVRYLQVFALVLRDFRDDQCALRATSLSFTTMLSLVPFLALAFAVLKGFGVHNRLELFILERVSAGTDEIVDKVITYIDHTNMASLGAVGLAGLVFTAVSLLGTIEEAFNVVWGVRETRSFRRKFSDYLSVVVSGPLLIFAAMSISTSLQSQSLVRWLVQTSYLGDILLFVFRLVPYLSIWIALVFLYYFIPNTRVKVRSALFGGFLTGICWQAAQWGYIHFQVGVAKYNAIYGTMASLPVFMVWLYTSWLIVLFGLEVVYAHQNIRTYCREIRTPVMSQRVRELVALALLARIASAFQRGEPAWTVERLSETMAVPGRFIRDILAELVTAGYLMETAGTAIGYLPAREPDRIAVAEVLRTLRDWGNDLLGGCLRGEAEAIATLERVGEGGRAAIAGLTLKDLVTPDPYPGRQEETRV